MQDCRVTKFALNMVNHAFDATRSYSDWSELHWDLMHCMTKISPIYFKLELDHLLDINNPVYY